VITALQNLTVEDYLSMQSATPAAPVYVWAAERHKGRPARFLVRYDGGPRVQVGVVVKLPANSCGPRAFLASRWVGSVELVYRDLVNGSWVKAKAALLGAVETGVGGRMNRPVLGSRTVVVWRPRLRSGAF